MYFLDAEKIRALDSETIASGTPGLVLMERAGYAAYKFLTDVFAPKAKRFLVLGGCGNNGGDGWVVARYLIQRGLHCDVVLLGRIIKLKGDALTQFRRLERLAPIAELSDPEAIREYLSVWQGDVIVDAMTGTGFHGGAGAFLASAISSVNAHPAKVLALDVPSGLSADGEESRLFVKADWTVTFGHAKLATLTDNDRFCGRTEIVDIGLNRPRNAESLACALSLTEARRLLPKPDNASYKHARGHLLLLAGSEGMGGAAILAAKAASLGGAGLVTAAVPASLVPSLNTALPNVLTLALSGDLEKDKEILSQNWERFDAAALGPGWKEDGYHKDLLRAVAASPIGRQVWDAGALSIFAGEPFDLSPETEFLFTPHAGEFKKLSGELPPPDDKGRIKAAQGFADKLNLTLLLKGHHTAVCAPGSLPGLNLSGNPYLSTAGTGDLLLGLAGAFLAQGLKSCDAALLAAYYHGLAADFAVPLGGRDAADFAAQLGRALNYGG